MENHAAEGGHWYSKEGEPRYTIVGKNGKERPTTLRDARKNGWLPGVTTIIKLAAAPFLQQWIIDQHILACLTTERRPGETEADYITRIKTDASEQARTAREKGKIVHAWVQDGFEDKKLDAEGYSYYMAAKNELENALNADIKWVCEQPFATERYGGKIDLQSEKYIIDIKTTEKPLDNVKIWDDHYMQLAAYRRDLKRECGILYINTLSPEAKLLMAEEEELVRGLACVTALADFWRAKNRIE